MLSPFDNQDREPREVKTSVGLLADHQASKATERSTANSFAEEHSAEVPVPEHPKIQRPSLVQIKAWRRCKVSQRLAILMYLLRRHELNDFGQIRLLRIQEWIPEEGLEAAFKTLQKLEKASDDLYKTTLNPFTGEPVKVRSQEVVDARRMLGSLAQAIAYANTYCKTPTPRKVRKGDRIRGYRDKGTQQSVSSQARSDAAKEFSDYLSYPNDCYPPETLRYLGTLYPSQVINLVKYHTPPGPSDCPPSVCYDLDISRDRDAQESSGQLL